MAIVSEKPLSRTITAAEAQDGYLRIEKAWLRKLPELGDPFQLKLGNSQLKVRIEEAETTTTNGRPQTQYRLRLPLIDLVEGAHATLRPVKGGLVVLEM